MKIRMKTTARGPEFSADAGKVVDVPEPLALELKTRGFAAFVDPDPTAPGLNPVEDASAPPNAETAEASENRRRRR
jgi:hypothetical protein